MQHSFSNSHSKKWRSACTVRDVNVASGTTSIIISTPIITPYRPYLGDTTIHWSYDRLGTQCQSWIFLINTLCLLSDSQRPQFAYHSPLSRMRVSFILTLARLERRQSFLRHNELALINGGKSSQLARLCISRFLERIRVFLTEMPSDSRSYIRRERVKSGCNHTTSLQTHSREPCDRM